MNKTKELKTTLKLVEEVLCENEEARNSDDKLYVAVCEKIDAISINLPFCKVMANRKNYNYPAFESVRRTRQKLVSKFPELSGDSDVEAIRVLNEEVFREFARGEV